MHLMRRQPLRRLALFLAGTLLLWQFCLVYHQTEHALNDSDKICLLCQAADHMQHGLAAADFAAFPFAAHDSVVIKLPSLQTQSFHAPSARGPPAVGPGF